MKTYVVSVWFDFFGRDTVKILYAGQDEYKAFNTNVSDYSTAEIEVWENGRKTEWYTRVYDTNKWRLELE